ncbi:MAG TPA: FkbM family methyltransferase [Chthoniobacterales bacterium]|nr:FkbM family methyltransferase [Chthoniobacterales bacterium]
MKRLLKFILPNGVVDFIRDRRKLREAGRRLSPVELFSARRLALAADVSGLTLFPPGHTETLRCIVDVGANVGQWSDMLLDCITPEKLIIAEPIPAAFAVLQKKFGNKPGVELHHLAIGEAEGVAKLKITRNTTGASLLQPREEMRALVGGTWSIASEIEVKMTTLDRLLADLREVSLLKIDVQGYEKQVLAGATQTLPKTKFILVELNFMPQYDGGSWLGEIHQILTRDFGFFLANGTAPLVLNGRASMIDGLYVNPNLVQEWNDPRFCSNATE